MNNHNSQCPTASAQQPVPNSQCPTASGHQPVPISQCPSASAQQPVPISQWSSQIDSHSIIIIAESNMSQITRDTRGLHIDSFTTRH